jgi:hypothetical protein
LPTEEAVYASVARLEPAAKGRRRGVSRSNYDKPFYVDMGKDIASIRCASNGDVIDSLDHDGSEHAIKIIERTCERMNREVEGLETVKLRQALCECIKQMCDRCRAAESHEKHPVPCLYGCDALNKAKAALEGGAE